MADINSSSTNESGCIANNLPLKVMRIAMENKGIFSNTKPGSLYCFTGKTTPINVTLENGSIETYNIPVTIAISGPDVLSANTNYGIKFTVDSNGNVSGGILVSITNN